MASFIEKVAAEVTTEEDQNKVIKVLDHAYVRTTLFFAARSLNKTADDSEIYSQAEEMYVPPPMIQFTIFFSFILPFLVFSCFSFFVSRQGILDNECQNYFHFSVTCMKGERVDCSPFFKPLIDCAAGRLKEDDE